MKRKFTIPTFLPGELVITSLYAPAWHDMTQNNMDCSQIEEGTLGLVIGDNWTDDYGSSFVFCLFGEMCGYVSESALVKA